MTPPHAAGAAPASEPLYRECPDCLAIGKAMVIRAMAGGTDETFRCETCHGRGFVPVRPDAGAAGAVTREHLDALRRIREHLHYKSFGMSGTLRDRKDVEALDAVLRALAEGEGA